MPRKCFDLELRDEIKNSRIAVAYLGGDRNLWPLASGANERALGFDHYIGKRYAQPACDLQQHIDGGVRLAALDEPNRQPVRTDHERQLLFVQPRSLPFGGENLSERPFVVVIHAPSVWTPHIVGGYYVNH